MSAPPYLEKYKEKSASEILEKNLKAVATLIVYDSNGKLTGRGSGFFLNHEGKLATNYHVIEKGSDVEAKMASGAFYKFKGVIKVDREEDLAILQFDAKDTPAVELGDSGLIEAGQKIIAIGTPVGLESTVSEGIVSNPKRTLAGHDYIQFTAPISPGNSGGGLFNKAGDVVGITAAIRDIPATQEHAGTQNLNLAVPVNKLKTDMAGEAFPLTEGSAAFFYSKGNLADNEKKYGEAIQLYAKALTKDDQYTDAYIGIAGDYFKLKKYDKEVEAYEAAVKSDSTNTDAHYFLGTAYEDIGEFDKAIDEYKTVLRIDPSYTEALHDLAMAYVVQGDKDQARALLLPLKEQNPGWGRKIELLLK